MGPIALALGAGAAGRPADAGLAVDRVVLVMRHGVRPPTKAPPLPAEIVPGGWPAWPVAPGWLTPHGAAAVMRLGEADRARFVALGLIPANGCPVGAAMIADSDQRTIATAEAWAAGLAPGCAIANEHRPQGESDPLFNAIEAQPAGLDVARANADITAAIGPGGIAAREAAERPLLARLDRILCGAQTGTCGVARTPSGLVAAAPGKRPRLTGALDRASTAAQILLLEYAEGKQLSEVGWGRAKPADITALSHFHALEFALLARPRAVAAANMAGLSRRIVSALSTRAAGAPAITLISGHDTNVANLGGLIGGHWHVPGFAEDDPTPGGAIVLARLRDAAGHFYVRAWYRSQSLEQIRAAARPAGPGSWSAMPIMGCADPCTLGALPGVLGLR